MFPIQSRLAVEMFKTMIACGYRPDAATYSIMIDCCTVIRGFKSACALIALMIRDGFYPQVVTYTALIEVCLLALIATHSLSFDAAHKSGRILCLVT